MRFWFAHSSEVPIYRQLVTQVALAVLCGDLRPGDRLPSTRELARRFGLHPNTVSAGYRLLEKEGWTERRRGSGVTIRAKADAPTTPEQRIDHHIAGFFRAAREMGLPAGAVRERVLEWMAAGEPERFVLVDDDAGARRILLTELRALTAWPVDEASVEDCCEGRVLEGAIPLCRPSQAKAVRAGVPRGVEVVTLPIRSANAWLSPWLPAPAGHLLGVVSEWSEFLESARTMLIAAGLPVEALVIRNAREARWRRGLEQVTAILCDSYTAGLGRLPERPFHIVFRVLADSAAEMLREYTQKAAGE
ncbi:MAG TPA: GntR family transcriptional regulator [Acidobacteriaceae bacterium]|nr:GntR family transcriptional regulator [Acidobacteriaceae bacterium]